MANNSEVLPPIKQKVGEIVEVSVPTNPSTGYACTLSKMPGCIYLVSSAYLPHHNDVAGAGGSQIFRFIAVSKGDGDLEFREVKFSTPLEIQTPGPMQKRFVIITD